MNINAAQSWLKEQLTTIYDSVESNKMADMVMENLTGQSRASRMLHHEPLDEDKIACLTQMHQRLLQHEPVQYVLEEAWFYGLKLFVNNAVLIPRPETEELVDWIVKDVQASVKTVFKKAAATADATTSLKIIDVGTGSGCIALALKKAMPIAEVWACDVSDAALTVARRNGSELDIRVDFVSLDFLTEERKQLPHVDIIVSNPPYIPLQQVGTMQSNVTAFEPHTALFVPDDDPLIFYKALAVFGTEKLHNSGAIYAEIHEGLGDAVLHLFENRGYNAELKKDMQGKERMIKATIS